MVTFGRRRPFRLFGHRGTPLSAPENSMASFEQTLAAGCGFETDLRRLADGTIVLFHDSEVARRPVEELTWPELCEIAGPVVRLIELESFSGKCPMILEVKEAGWEIELLPIVSGWRDVVISSFSLPVLEGLRAAGCPHPFGLIAEEAVATAAAAAVSLGASVFFPHYYHVTADLVEILHGQGLELIPWSPNSPAVWNELLELACDGVITDVPALAEQWLTTRS